MTRVHFVPLAAVVLSSALPAQTLSVLVKDGDTPTGGAAVITIDNLAVNSLGTWMVRASMVGSISVIVKNGSAFLVEGAALSAPVGASINAFEDMTLNILGTSAWNFYLNGTVGGNDDSGIYVDSTLVIQESNVSTAPQFPLGTPYRGFFGTKWNDARQMLLMATVNDPAITGTIDRALVLLQLDASNALVSETVLMKKGDTQALFGLETLADFETSPYAMALNNQGSAMWVLDMTGPTTNDNAVVIDGVVVALEGAPSPVSGRNYELLTSRPVDLGDGGHWVIRANLDGNTADDEVIVRDGALFKQEGDPAPGGFAFTVFGTVVRIDAAGRVFWFGAWNDPDTTRDSGLFVDGTLLVQEGVTTVGGIVIENIATVQDTLSISPDGRFVIFEGKLAGGVDAAFLMDLGPSATPFCFGDVTGAPCPCGNSGASGRGCANSAFASGTLLTSSGVAGASASTDSLVLTAVDIPGPGMFFQGTGQYAGGFGVSFGDGLLCVGGELFRLGIVFPTGGTASYPGGLTPNPIHIGGATASGDVRNYQCWYRDAITFCTSDTYNLTQALAVTWGP